jgi:hypothetical protein
MRLLVIFIFQVTSEDFDSTFNPSVLSHNVNMYVNQPLQMSNTLVHLPIMTNFTNLIHQPQISGVDSVIGLALYKNFMSGFYRLIGSLRSTGYVGHIILGVNPKISPEELKYLKSQNVTLYAVELSDCLPSAVSQIERTTIRGKCSVDLPDLKLEWGRFEMARRWIAQCPSCSGWSLVIDTRDLFFQAHPVRFTTLTHIA